MFEIWTKKCPVYLKLPYNLNEVVQQNLKKIVDNCYRVVKLRVVFKNNKLFKIDNRDKLPSIIIAMWFINMYVFVNKYTWEEQVTL